MFLVQAFVLYLAIQHLCCQCVIKIQFSSVRHLITVYKLIFGPPFGLNCMIIFFFCWNYITTRQIDGWMDTQAHSY